MIDAVDGEVVCKKEAFTTTLSAEELTFGGSTVLAVRKFEEQPFICFFSLYSLFAPSNFSEKSKGDDFVMKHDTQFERQWGDG